MLTSLGGEGRRSIAGSALSSAASTWTYLEPCDVDEGDTWDLFRRCVDIRALQSTGVWHVTGLRILFRQRCLNCQSEPGPIPVKPFVESG